MSDADLTVLRCWFCEGSGQRDERRCLRCDGAGSLFWVSGRAYPYTPYGEKVARSALNAEK